MRWRRMSLTAPPGSTASTGKSTTSSRNGASTSRFRGGAFEPGAIMETMNFAYREKLTSLLGWLVDGYWPRDDELDGAIETIRSPTCSYTLQRLLASGNAA